MFLVRRYDTLLFGGAFLRHLIVWNAFACGVMTRGSDEYLVFAVVLLLPWLHCNALLWKYCEGIIVTKAGQFTHDPGLIEGC